MTHLAEFSKSVRRAMAEGIGEVNYLAVEQILEACASLHNLALLLGGR
jgi:hypothetical protein